MAVQDVNINFDFNFGSNGSGNGEFNYPAGITIANNYIYVVDKQNHRIQYFDLSGAYIGQFGTVGSGNNNFYFPEDICSDGTYLYITDSANHRVKIHDFTGAFIGEFGARGVGDTHFNYPIGIDTDNTYLYIADRQNNRVKKHDLVGVFVLQITGFSYPEGIAVFDTDKIAICDSGNDQLSLYNVSGIFVSNITNTEFEYIVGVCAADGALVIVDRQRNSLFTYNYDAQFISEYSNNFNFPISIVYDAEKIYITDSANHRVQIYDYVVSEETFTYFQNLINLTKQLYPTGRSWWIALNSFFYKLHEGLVLSESRAYEQAVNLLFKILPDNDIFSEEDATNWERALGLIISPSLTLDERKIIIERKIQFPGDVLARQHYLYVQGELRKVGFDVYIFENRIPIGGGDYVILNPVPSIYAEFNYGQATYGGAGIGSFTKIANYIDETKDDLFNFGLDVNLRATFFVGGVNLGDRADVDIERKKEFRELLLKLKPAQTAGFLLIDYV